MDTASPAGASCGEVMTLQGVFTYGKLNPMGEEGDPKSHVSGSSEPQEAQCREPSDPLASFPVRSERGWLHLAEGDYDFAADAFNEVLNVSSTDEGAVQGRIMALRSLGRYEDAEAAIEDGLRRLPGNAAVLAEHGWLHLQRKDFDKALAAFQDVLILVANDERALEGRISALRSLGRYEEAQEAVEDALRRVPGSPAILVQQGWLSLLPGGYHKALSTFQELLDLNPVDERALEGRITALRSLGRYDDAEQAIEESLCRVPGSTPILYQRAQLCLNRGDYDLAVFAFQEVVITLVKRGWECLNQSRFDLSLSIFEDALVLAPNDEGAIAGKRAVLSSRDAASRMTDL